MAAAGKAGQVRMLGADGQETWADLPIGPGAAWIRIGPAQDDILPKSKAERVLQMLFDRDPELLAALVGEASTGAAPRRPRARRAPA